MQKFGRYEIMHELGRGGMAAVYLAYDPSFDRYVAIKVLPSQFMHDTQFRTRFLREAKVIAALEHPYIVPVYDFGEENDQPYIVMRYMLGGTLSSRLAAGPLPPVQFIPIMQRLAEALDEAHSQNIIHRDLKPSNVMFDARGQAFLSDFGLAKLSAASTKLTFTGVMIGTPDYMSPEQAMGEEEVDRRSDVYSLGVIFYEMLTGRTPHEAGTPMRVLYKHLTASTPQVNTTQLKLPAECNRVLARALSKEPAKRYQTAGALAEAMSAIWPDIASRSSRIQSARPGFSERSPRLAKWLARRWWQIGGLLGLLLIVALLGMFFLPEVNGFLGTLGVSASQTPTGTSSPTTAPRMTRTPTPSATATTLGAGVVLPTFTLAPSPTPEIPPTQTPPPTAVIFVPTVAPTVVNLPTPFPPPPTNTSAPLPPTNPPPPPATEPPPTEVPPTEPPPPPPTATPAVEATPAVGP